MKPDIATTRRLDILGNGNCSSDQAIFTATLKKWRQRFGYLSIFAAIPAVLSSNLPVAKSDDGKKPERTVARKGTKVRARLNASGSNSALLKRQSEFLLPHQKGNFSLLPTVAGNDDCPGRNIPGGNYTAAAPYVDSGDTTGANNTVNRIDYYYYYNIDAFGPDHIYSFTLTGRGPNPQIQVSTTSGSYKPLVYVMPGGYTNSCPAGTGNYEYAIVVSEAPTAGGTATLNNAQVNYLPLNYPLHLLVDSRLNVAGPYSIRLQDVTISPSVCSNPIDCPEFFLYQQYVDFLSREPDPPGIAGWLTLLNNCPSGDTSCDRIHVSEAFFKSPEFLGRGYFLYRFYPVSFGRKPDYSEFGVDRWQLSGFLTDAQLETAKLQFISEFMSRPAFVNKFGGLNNTQYVDTLLSTAGVTHPARDFWIAALTNGTRTRLQVLREISESNEVYNKYYNQAFVVMQYFGYLQRQPDALYLDWIAYLNATGDSRSMINGFINSVEYRARFGP